MILLHTFTCVRVRDLSVKIKDNEIVINLMFVGFFALVAFKHMQTSQTWKKEKWLPNFSCTNIPTSDLMTFANETKRTPIHRKHHDPNEYDGFIRICCMYMWAMPSRCHTDHSRLLIFLCFFIIRIIFGYLRLAFLFVFSCCYLLWYSVLRLHSYMYARACHSLRGVHYYKFQFRFARTCKPLTFVCAPIPSFTRSPKKPGRQQHKYNISPW